MTLEKMSDRPSSFKWGCFEQIRQQDRETRTRRSTVWGTLRKGGSDLRFFGCRNKPTGHSERRRCLDSPVASNVRIGETSLQSAEGNRPVMGQ